LYSSQPRFHGLRLPANGSTHERELDLSLNDLSKLNAQSVSTVLKAGTLIVLPEPSRFDVFDSSRFVASSIRTTAPLDSPPTPKDVVEIKSDQSLASFIRDHGITLQQLKDLNPGVQLSRTKQLMRFPGSLNTVSDPNKLIPAFRCACRFMTYQTTYEKRLTHRAEGH
jgi:hypothetical protein